MSEKLDTTQAWESCRTVLEASPAGAAPEWLVQQRAAAWSAFVHTGLPTRKQESWRYTDISPITAQRFDMAPDEAPALSPEAIKRFTYWESSAARLVLVDGRFSPELSSLEGLPDGVIVRDFRSLLRESPDTVGRLVSRTAWAEKDAFALLNESLMSDGAIVHIPKGVSVGMIHLLHIGGTLEGPVMSHPRTLIALEEGASATVVERYAGLDDEAVYLRNAVTEILLEDRARLEHYKVQRESQKAFHVATMGVRQRRDSEITTTSIAVGARIGRTFLGTHQEGVGTRTELNGLYVVDGDRHIDNHLSVHHADSHGSSEQFYKGIVDERGSAIFNGEIIADQTTKGTEAHQTNNNLLLSDDAVVNTRPQLEIHADDIACSHGASIGALDEQALFYLRSRGIAQESARSMLTYGFASDVIDRLRIDAMRSRLQEYLADHTSWGRIGERS